MFKHGEKEVKVSSEGTKPIIVPAQTSTTKVPPAPIAPNAIKDVSPLALRELLEKNLKWSQIIYEQNRRINRKLFWAAFANWLKLFLIAIPLILSIIFLPPLIKQYMSSYKDLLPGGGGSSASSSLQNLLEILPLSPQQQAQLKAMLNK